MQKSSIIAKEPLKLLIWAEDYIVEPIRLSFCDTPAYSNLFRSEAKLILSEAAPLQCHLFVRLITR